MDVDLKSRKVVVTGASDGIGRAIALAFGQAGAHVAGCARSEDRVKALNNEIEGSGHWFQKADLTRAEDAQVFHDQTLENLTGVDILINNVGSVQKLANFFDLTDEDWEEAFNINLMSAVRMIRLFTHALRQSGAPRIINISSIAAGKPGEVFPHYSAMKAGLSNLTVSLAQTLAPDKILVNTVSPGPVWTQSWENEAKEAARQSNTDLKEMREKIRKSTAETVPLKRMGVPEDVVGLVLFLASDHAGWITGSNFPVDGGIV